jgi:ComF family protein
MDRVIAATFYEGVARTAIHQFKFHHKTSLAKPFAHMILNQLPQDLDMTVYQAILSVPLHPRRHRQRGYNQSEMLARELSKALHLPLMCHTLRRTRQTNEQALLTDRSSRHVNIRDAFQVAQPISIKGKALILVDDVVTTGATVGECARMLKQEGADSVLVLAIARRVLRASIPSSIPPIKESATV